MLVNCFGARDASLADIRALTFCLLGFAGFLRYDELSKLKLCDITIYEDHMELFIESSKTDQLWQGAIVVIARTGTNLPHTHVEVLYTDGGYHTGRIR